MYDSMAFGCPQSADDASRPSPHGECGTDCKGLRQARLATAAWCMLAVVVALVGYRFGGRFAFARRAVLKDPPAVAFAVQRRAVEARLTDIERDRGGVLIAEWEPVTELAVVPPTSVDDDEGDEVRKLFILPVRYFLKAEKNVGALCKMQCAVLDGKTMHCFDGVGDGTDAAIVELRRLGWKVRARTDWVHF